MARPIRIEYAGALYHVTSRGDRREGIFVDDYENFVREGVGLSPIWGALKRQVFR